MFKITYFKKLKFSKSHFQQNSHFQNLIVYKKRIFRIFKFSFSTKITLFTKIAFSNFHFHKNHIFKNSFFTKIKFQKPVNIKIHIFEYHFSQNSHYLKYRIQVNLRTKSVILPQCENDSKTNLNFCSFHDYKTICKIPMTRPS